MRKAATDSAPQIRELFIEELAEIQGGTDSEDLIEKIREMLKTTMACCEEGPGCC